MIHAHAEEERLFQERLIHEIRRYLALYQIPPEAAMKAQALPNYGAG